MRSKKHWEDVYATKGATELSWFQEHAALSMKLISDALVPHGASIIDVGGGASRLVDDLLDAGFHNVTVLDLSATALAIAQARLGARAAAVKWVEGNILRADLPAHGVDVWHDRAVFHFLISPDERRAYVEAVRRAVRPGGLVIVATFADDGPTKCSGLPVMRYNEAELHGAFGEPFVLVDHQRESHQTPSGIEQKFVYCLCRRVAS